MEHELTPTEYLLYQSFKGQEELLRKEAAALLRMACVEEQKANAIIRNHVHSSVDIVLE